LSVNLLFIPSSGGEEAMYVLSKMYFDSSWIQDGFVDLPVSKYLFRFIVGHASLFLSFDSLIFWFSLLNIFFYAYALTKLFEVLEIKIIAALAMLQIFIFVPEGYLGGEWIFKTFEAKTLAYPFIILSLRQVLLNNYNKAVIPIIFACYFHVLIGGWFLLSILIYELYSNRNIKSTFLFGVKFVLGILPIIILIGIDFYNNKDLDFSEFGNVLAYGRLKGHIGIFEKYHFPSVLYLGLLIYIIVFAISLKGKFQSKIKIINDLNLFSCLIILFALIILSIDTFLLGKKGNIILLAYPFRIAAMSTFYIFLISLNWIHTNCSPIMKKTILAICILVLPIRLYIEIYKNKIEHELGFPELTDYIRNHTLENDKFLILNSNPYSYDYLSFIRTTERDNFFVKKFLPVSKGKIYEWNEKWKDFDLARKNFKHSIQIGNKYNVKYLISDFEAEHSKLKPIVTFENFNLYLIEH
jgi:hypothetical protein